MVSNYTHPQQDVDLFTLLRDESRGSPPETRVVCWSDSVHEGGVEGGASLQPCSAVTASILQQDDVLRVDEAFDQDLGRTASSTRERGRGLGWGGRRSCGVGGQTGSFLFP